jgi:uncharacterized protein
MNKIELEIIALSHSITQSHSYAVVLGEVNGNRRLPIVIGSNEAQAIAVALEKVQPTRPLTHDLIKNLFGAFDAELLEVVINDLQEGIFYSHLICSTSNDTLEIDSRTSDALALAVRFGCPIYTFEHILDQAGILMEENQPLSKKKVMDELDEEPMEGSMGNQELRNMSLDDLNKLLDEVLEQEDYIKAIAIRDEIKTRKEGRSR